MNGKQQGESCKSKHSMQMKPYSLSFKSGSEMVTDLLQFKYSGSFKP